MVTYFCYQCDNSFRYQCKTKIVFCCSILKKVLYRCLPLSDGTLLGSFLPVQKVIE